MLDTEVPRAANFLGASHLGMIPMGFPFSDTLLFLIHLLFVSYRKKILGRMDFCFESVWLCIVLNFVQRSSYIAHCSHMNVNAGKGIYE